MCDQDTVAQIEVLKIGQKLAEYGTYLCNRHHANSAGHICSFLVCPGPSRVMSNIILHLFKISLISY